MIGRAQGTRADYDRSAGLWDATVGRVYHARVHPHWSADGNAFWYATVGPDKVCRYWWVDALAGTREPLINPARLATALRAASIVDARRATLLPSYIDELAGDRWRVGVQVEMAGGFEWVGWMTLDRHTYQLTDFSREFGPALHPLPRVDEGQRSMADPDDGGDWYRQVPVLLLNRTGGPVSLFTVGGDGSRSAFASNVEDRGTGSPYWIQAGSVMAATDENGRTLGCWRVGRDGGQWVVDSPGRTAPTSGPATQPTAEPGTSPDRRWVAFAREHNLWLRDRRQGGPAAQLTLDGTAGDGYRDDSHVYWSPDSACVVGVRQRDGDRGPATQPAPYPVPDDPVPRVWPHLFDVAHRGREVPLVDLDMDDPVCFSDVWWDGDSARFRLVWTRRGHQVARALVVDANTGQTRVVADDRADTFVDPDRVGSLTDWPDHDLVWMSQRDGWNHLYRYDALTGKLLNRVTEGHWTVLPWDSTWDCIDANHSGVFFRAAGVDRWSDPYYVHYCWTPLDGSGTVTDLTPGDGTHTRQESPGGRYFLDTYSRVDLPPVTELRRYDGTLACDLERADATDLLATGWRYPERFTAKGRDGKTDIYGVIYRPTNFDPAKRYPVVEDIYAGPQKFSVPKAFVRCNYPKQIAELGFIVVQLDGMGTPGRSKAFHDVCWHNWGDCGLDDRVAWIRAAAARHPEMDLKRVGVYGSSYGGYAAVRAMETHGDFYKVGVAEDGTHDLRMYRADSVERYMGWPTGPWYDEQSNIAHADRIDGPLLLVESAMDRNVNPASTARLADALTKAGKPFELMVVPNADHCGGGDAVDLRRKDFLVRHLLGVEPRAR